MWTSSPKVSDGPPTCSPSTHSRTGSQRLVSTFNRRNQDLRGCPLARHADILAILADLALQCATVQNASSDNVSPLAELLDDFVDCMTPSVKICKMLEDYLYIFMRLIDTVRYIFKLSSRYQSSVEPSLRGVVELGRRMLARSTETGNGDVDMLKVLKDICDDCMRLLGLEES